MPKDEYNDGYTHEALHMAHVLTDTWERHLAENTRNDP